MTTINLELNNDQAKWLSDWATMQAYASPQEGIVEVLKVCGGLPRGPQYWKDKFTFAE